MGYKYEMAIWTKDSYSHNEWCYRTEYAGNSFFRLVLALWKHRKNGCRKVEIR